MKKAREATAVIKSKKGLFSNVLALGFVELPLGGVFSP